jgi:hypothetical protein
MEDYASVLVVRSEAKRAMAGRQDRDDTAWLMDVCAFPQDIALYLKWGLVLTFFLTEEGDREELETKLHSLKASFIIVLGQVQAGLKDDVDDLLDKGERMQRFIKALRSKRERVQTVWEACKARVSSEGLGSSGRGEGKEWSCLRCDYVGPTSTTNKKGEMRKVLVCPECDTCRAHGDRGCLVLNCRMSSSRKGSRVA